METFSSAANALPMAIEFLHAAMEQESCHLRLANERGMMSFFM